MTLFNTYFDRGSLLAAAAFLVYLVAPLVF